MPEPDRLGRFLDSGYALAHWPKPWGRAAGAVEQLVIEEELRAADVRPPQYGIGGWIIQTLTQHADPDQLERWIRPSLEHQYVWCQLFSEPGAGSDAAGIRTRATKVDGGWVVNGQKVWTTGAAFCNRGFATVRTDPEKPKHDGITTMVIDLHAPGVDIRPLREASGGELFCEVFFDDVFVSDEDVVGPVDGGWRVARSTLGNERVSIGGGTTGDPSFDLLDLSHRHADGDPAADQAIGKLLAERRGMRLLNLRSAERAVAGAEPGPEGNVAKLLSAEHAQRVAALGLRIIGPAGALDDDGPDAGVVRTEVFARCLVDRGRDVGDRPQPDRRAAPRPPARPAAPVATGASPSYGARSPSYGRKLAPPSTLNTWPLIHSASSDIRNATIAAMSSGRPRRGDRPTLIANCRNSSGRLCAMAGVTTSPGAIALARIPSRPHLLATCRASELIPAFAAAYDGRSGSPMCPAAELV